MSIAALTWAKTYTTGSATAKAILMVLADYADDEWSCFPSQARIAGEAECSERTVRSTLARWESVGLIRRQYRGLPSGRGRTSDRIYILRPDQAELAADSTMTNRRQTADHPEIQNDQPATDVRPTGTGCRGTVRESVVEPSENRAAPVVASSLDVYWREFWDVYPNKVDRGKAQKAFVAATGKVTADVLISAAKSYASDPNRVEAYTKHPATWLNAEAWDNGPLPAKTGRRVAKGAIDNALTYTRGAS